MVDICSNEFKTSSGPFPLFLGVGSFFRSAGGLVVWDVDSSELSPDEVELSDEVLEIVEAVRQHEVGVRIGECHAAFLGKKAFPVVKRFNVRCSGIVDDKEGYKGGWMPHVVRLRRLKLLVLMFAL